MSVPSKFIAAALAAALLSGCGVGMQPTRSAFSRDVGPGSGISGPESDLGSTASGNTYVAGAPAAGGIGGMGGSR